MYLFEYPQSLAQSGLMLDGWQDRQMVEWMDGWMGDQKEE